MKLRCLVFRGLRFHWRSHLGVLLAATVSTAVLVGALAAGDSVRYSLRRAAESRIGLTDTAMTVANRFFREALAAEMAEALVCQAAPVLMLRGTVARDDGTARIGSVQIVGADGRFWAMGRATPPLPADAAEIVAIDNRTARRLGVGPGDGLLVRVAKPSAVPIEAPLSGEADVSLAMRVTVGTVVGDDGFGRFGLQANQVAPHNVFVPLGWLQKQLDLAGRANVLLVGGGRRPVTAPQADSALRHRWQLADAGLELRELEDRGVFELRSSRVFLDPAVVESLRTARRAGTVVLTYFVNELRLADRAVPYSMVTALGPLYSGAGVPPADVATPPAPLSPAEGRIVINSWLAQELSARPGDALSLTYYVPGPLGGLLTQSRSFTVAGIVPMEGAAADRDLMPDFPGLADVENCRLWKPGVPIDLRKIRKQDEDYWNRYRGTPKAFVSLTDGVAMWSNRWGSATAVRFPAADRSAESLRRMLRIAIDPASLGLYFQPVRDRALAAARQAVDFGQLFLGLSCFLVASALVLTGLLFALAAEQRSEETGVLLALGFSVRRVRLLMLAEGAAVSLAGCAAGTPVGLMYTLLVLHRLGTAWRGAVGGAELAFHVEPETLAVGAAAGFVAAVAAILLVVRRQARTPARELLSAGADAELRPVVVRQPPTLLRAALATAVLPAAAAATLIAWSIASNRGTAGTFFAAGALLLGAALATSYHLLASGRAAPLPLTLTSLVRRNAQRRRGRSMATVAMTACGVFLIVAVGAGRKDPMREVHLRRSGTGGFALVGESALPILHNPTSPDGRRAFALPESVASAIEVVPLRVREGDDASCLNLNRAQTPRLVGVPAQVLAQRGSFSFARTLPCPPGQSPWLLLKDTVKDSVVPAIADANTISWALGKSLGQEVPYTDARGRPMRLRLVAALEGSILQGSILIAEEAFVERFPDESGYRMLLIDAPTERAEEISRILSERLSDVGLALAPAGEKLAEFHAVENTYLAIFQALGGLGLILGTAGLGVVVLRNVMERRAELALMRAVGFARPTLVRVVVAEHASLLLYGTTCGAAAALTGVLPVAGAAMPYVSLGLTLAGVVASGLLWTYLAARWALAGRLLESLRNE